MAFMLYLFWLLQYSTFLESQPPNDNLIVIVYMLLMLHVQCFSLEPANDANTFYFNDKNVTIEFPSYVYMKGRKS